MLDAEVVTVDTGLGVTFQLALGKDDRDGVSQIVRSGACPVPESLQFLLSGVPRGVTVLDLGANIGTFAVAAAAFGYDVIAVEASDRNVELLRESVRLNGFMNIRVVSVAVFDRVGTVFFHQNGPYGMVNTSSSAPPGFFEVPTTTVDAILELLQPTKKVGFVKIDIKGSETAAVRGMARLLGGQDAPPVFYEANGFTLDFFDKTPAALVSEFRRHGYESYRAESKRLAPLDDGYIQYPCVVDYLATKGGLGGGGCRRPCRRGSTAHTWRGLCRWRSRAS